MICWICWMVFFIIIQDSPLFQFSNLYAEWLGQLMFSWRAGLWDLFRCLELSLESGDWGNDLWASPVEIDIFSTKINVNKISEWEKRIATCGVSPELLSFILKNSLSSFLVSLALEAAKVGNSTRTQSRNKNRPIWGVSSGQVKTCWFGRAPGSFLLPQLFFGTHHVGNIPSFWMMISGWNLLHNWIDHMWEWYPYCKMDHYISSLYESNAWMM